MAVIAAGALVAVLGVSALMAAGARTGTARTGTAPAASGPGCEAPPAAGSGGHQHQHAFPHPPDPAAGLGVAEAGVSLTVDRTELPAGIETAVELRLTRAGAPARPVRSGDVPMHVYLVRSDLGSYQHVHPIPTADCGWQVRVRPPTPGRYRLLTEFRLEGRTDTEPDLVLSRPATVPGTPARTPLPAPADQVEADGCTLETRGYAPAPENRC